MYQSQPAGGHAYTPQYAVAKQTMQNEPIDAEVTNMLKALPEGHAIRTDEKYHLDCKA